MYLWQNTRKVICTRDDVAAFNDSWPGSNLRDDRTYYFEFDENGDLIDTDVPQHDDGEAANALSKDAQVFMEENCPIAEARALLDPAFDLADESVRLVAADWLMERGIPEEVAFEAVVPEEVPVVEEPEFEEVEPITVDDLRIDANQGTDRYDRTFGYIYAPNEGDGGYFFTHLDTAEETLDSIEADEFDPPQFDAGLARERLEPWVANQRRYQEVSEEND